MTIQCSRRKGPRRTVQTLRDKTMIFNIESFLFGITAALLFTNVIDYWRNTEYAGGDMMGAVANWHIGFFLAWVPIIINCFLGNIFPWWSGFIAILIFPLVSFAVKISLSYLLKALGMTGKEYPRPNNVRTGRPGGSR